MANIKKIISHEELAIRNGILNAKEVRKIRERLRLTQKEASKICGGGVNSFSKYERGKALPLRATSNLLRLLNKYPKEIDYLLGFYPNKN